MIVSLARVALASAVFAALVTVAGCGAEASQGKAAEADAKAAAQIDAVPVEAAGVTRGDLEPAYASTANIEAERDARVMAEVPGEIVEVLVEEGMHVEAGAVLARIDSSRAQLQLRQEQSTAQRMKHDAERNEALLGRHMISREAYDRARFDRDTQQAAVNLARLTVDKGAIRAPYAGVVTRRHVKEGQWLEAGQPAFEIADFTALRARFDVPERVSSLIRPGQPVQFTADALPGEDFTATVERVSPVVDRATGTVAATLAIANRDGSKLRPGLFVRLAVTYDRIADATLMPKNAVVADPAGAHVFVVADGKAHKRDVQLGVEHGALVQVLAGVEPGNTVVTVGHKALKDGDPVTVLNLGADAQAATAAL